MPQPRQRSCSRALAFIAAAPMSRLPLAVLGSVLLAAVFGQLHAADLAPGDEQPGVAAPVLRVLGIDGLPQVFDDYRDTLTLVNFWAGWCTPCIDEMPGLVELAAAMPADGFRLLAVNVGEQRLRVQTLRRRLGLTFPVFLDPDGAAFAAWGADVLPTTFVVDRHGAIQAVVRGPRDWGDPGVVAQLRHLLPVALQ